jgi:FMN phosphatase YigB (HAD superfamily)
VNTIVVFDLGKVLVDYDYRIAARKIAAQSNLSSAKIEVLIQQSPLIIDYESGRLKRSEFFEQICRVTGYRETMDVFGRLFADIFTPIPVMIELHAELRCRGIPTYIFSNTNDLAVEHIQRNFPFYDNFDGYVLSYKIGIMKPDAGIYEALEKLAGRRGKEIIFFDDRLENMQAGAARGWRAVLHESPEKSRAEMEKIGLFEGNRH